jgi:hypothetical protein
MDTSFAVRCRRIAHAQTLMGAEQSTKRANSSRPTRAIPWPETPGGWLVGEHSLPAPGNIFTTAAGTGQSARHSEGAA